MQSLFDILRPLLTFNSRNNNVLAHNRDYDLNVSVPYEAWKLVFYIEPHNLFSIVTKIREFIFTKLNHGYSLTINPLFPKGKNIANFSVDEYRKHCGYLRTISVSYKYKVDGDIPPNHAFCELQYNLQELYEECFYERG